MPFTDTVLVGLVPPQRRCPRAYSELATVREDVPLTEVQSDAANSSVHAVCRAALDRLHGQYLERCVPVAPSAAALDEQLEREITARSDALVAPWLRPVDAHTS